MVTNPDSLINLGDAERYDYKYDYPDDLNLKPGGELHQRLLSRLLRYSWEAAKVQSSRRPAWDEINKTLTAYISLSDKERLIKHKDPRKPVSIVFPYSYAILETLVSYLVAAFLPDPMFRYEGTAPEDVAGAILMEKVIQLQVLRNKVGLNLHTLFRDACAYGFGVCSPYWLVRKGRKQTRQERGFYDGDGQFTQTGFARGTSNNVLFEGNAISNIDPYNYLPDPNYSIHDVQKGEYVAWLDRTNYMDLLGEEQDDPTLFNVRYLRHSPNRASGILGSNSRTSRTHSLRSDTANFDRSISLPVDQLHIYAKLIPSQWKLGDSDIPEKWLFTVGNDSIIVRANPLDLDHDMFPVVIAAPDFDGYSPLAYSRLEILGGMQTTIDWLFNCFSDDTEVLTSNGWQLISEAMKQNAEVATVDPDTGMIRYEIPKQWFEYDYDDYLLYFKSARHDILVTPNHKLYGAYRTSHGKLTERQFVEAIYVNYGLGHSEFKIPTTASWHEESIQDITLDSGTTISGNTFAAYLGWLLSDGGIHHSSASGTYIAAITQSKNQNWDNIDSILASMPFHVTEYRDEPKKAERWVISNKKFYTWLANNCYLGGTTGEYKRIPQFIKDAGRFAQKLFFDAFVAGDGHIFPNNPNLIRIGTESLMLADDLQEMCMKLGYSCTIRESTTAYSKQFWYLNINTLGPDSAITQRPSRGTGGTYKVRYIGKVYCFENSTHLSVFRRDGKAYICSQSHIANVRKAINDVLVVDPYLLNIEDLRDPEPGGLVRLRRPAWGRGVENAVKQLAVTDITRTNLQDVSFIIEYMQTMTGTDNAVMGNLRKGGPERLSAREFQGTAQGAVNRLERIAKVIGLQAFQDLGYMFAHHAQQFMSQDVYVKTVGDWPDSVQRQFNIQDNRIRVSPLDILVDYDLIVRDGSVPGGNFSDVWTQLFQIIGTNEQLAQHFDVVNIFKYIATSLGAKNVDAFERSQPAAQVMARPDEEVMNQVQNGELVSLLEQG
jgi:YHS domain-containing protein